VCAHSHFFYLLFYSRHRHHRTLHSFPTRRSSDLTRLEPGTAAALLCWCCERDHSDCPRDGAAFGTEQEPGLRTVDGLELEDHGRDRKSTRLNSSHLVISYAVFCLKKKTKTQRSKK